MKRQQDKELFTRYAMKQNLLSVPKLIIRLSCLQFVKRKLVKYLQEILDIFHNGVSTLLVIVTFQIIESFSWRICAQMIENGGNIYKDIVNEGNSNAVAFVEQTQSYPSKPLKEIRQDIVSEVGELLPWNCKYVRTRIPVSAI